MAFVRAWNIRKVETCEKRVLFRILISHLISHLLIWVGTDTRWSGSVVIALKRSLFVSPGPSNAVKGPTEALSCIARGIELHCGTRARDQRWNCGFLTAIHGSQSELVTARSCADWMCA